MEPETQAERRVLMDSVCRARNQATENQISLEPELGAYESLAQNESALLGDFLLISAALGVRGQKSNPRHTPLCTTLQLKCLR